MRYEVRDYDGKLLGTVPLDHLAIALRDKDMVTLSVAEPLRLNGMQAPNFGLSTHHVTLRAEHMPWPAHFSTTYLTMLVFTGGKRSHLRRIPGWRGA